MTFAEPTNVSSIVDIVKYSNTTTNGLYGGMLLLCVFIISFAVSKRYSNEVALAPASFLTFLTAVMLSILQLIPGELVAVTIVLLIVSVFMNR